MKTTLVRDLMQIGVPTCRAGVTLLEAVRRLINDGLESLVVLDEHGHAIGLFGRKEAVAAYGISGARNYALNSLTVADVMSQQIPEIPPDIPAPAAVQLMLKPLSSRLAKQLVGCFNQSHCQHAMDAIANSGTLLDQARSTTSQLSHPLGIRIGLPNIR